MDEGKELVDSKDSGVGSSGGQDNTRIIAEEGKEGGGEKIESDEQEVEHRDWVAALPVNFKSSFSNPTFGPFLTCLLQKVEGMVHNTMFINLHLTGLLSRLACYPQPLITSCLLNPNLVFQPSIRSLFQVLGSLRHRIDSYAYTVNNFESLLVRGRKHMCSREKKYFNSGQNEETSSTGDLRVVSIHNQNETAVKPRSFSEILQFASSESRKIFPDAKPRSSTIADVGLGSRQKIHRIYHHHKSFHQSSDSSLEALRTKNIVYCAIVLEEFLKELAAISQEHAVACCVMTSGKNF